VCRFAASPDSGYCFPNRITGQAGSLHAMARAQTPTRRIWCRAAAAPSIKLAASRAAVHARVGVETAPPAAATDSALAEIVARTKDIDGVYGAFAMADDTTATIAATAKSAPATRPSTATASADRAPVKVASLAPEAIIATATLAPATPAVAPRKGAGPGGGVPTINVMPSCRAAANAILGMKRDLEACLKSEASARDQLAQEWAEFLPAERTSCLALTTMGGGGTYTELLTCLDLRRFARNMHKDDPATRIAAR
jgi:hypothetical protein